uniref:Phosphoserine aminotransferase n=1 Tax=Rhizophora mucronata TaxID=61149 RepID=A0A2P2PY64_RHIMU
MESEHTHCESIEMKQRQQKGQKCYMGREEDPRRSTKNWKVKLGSDQLNITQYRHDSSTMP